MSSTRRGATSSAGAGSSRRNSFAPRLLIPSNSTGLEFRRARTWSLIPSNSMELETNSTDNMTQPKNPVIEVHGTAVSIHSAKHADYLSLTNILPPHTHHFFL